MAVSLKDNLEVEPAVKASFANRELARRNSRAQSNWEKVRKGLEKQQKDVRNELDINKSKLLRQRERIQATTINLNTQLLPISNSVPKSDEEEVPGLNKPFTFADVYKALMASRPAQKRLDSVMTEPVNLTKSTKSSEMKKVARKPMGFTLGQLQMENSSLNSKLKSIQNGEEVLDDSENVSATEEEKQRMPGLFDLSKEEQSSGPLHCPPVMLPPIRNQFVFKPQVQTFEKESEEYKERLNNRSTVDDVRHCRYLRLGKKRQRIPDAGRFSRRIYRKHHT